MLHYFSCMAQLGPAHYAADLHLSLLSPQPSRPASLSFFSHALYGPVCPQRPTSLLDPIFPNWPTFSSSPPTPPLAHFLLHTLLLC
jgi:hypothetical protein